MKNIFVNILRIRKHRKSHVCAFKKKEQGILKNSCTIPLRIGTKHSTEKVAVKWEWNRAWSLSEERALRVNRYPLGSRKRTAPRRSKVPYLISWWQIKKVTLFKARVLELEPKALTTVKGDAISITKMWSSDGARKGKQGKGYDSSMECVHYSPRENLVQGSHPYLSSCFPVLDLELQSGLGWREQ